jgi:hypothetical protein
VSSTTLSVSLSDWSELSCDSDNPFSQLPKKIAMDKINPTAIMKNLFVLSCFIVYFFKKVYITKKAPTKVSAIFVK